MKKWQIFITLVVVIIFASAGFSHAQQSKSGKTWKVYFSTMMHQNNYQGKIIEKWAKEIEEQTGGALKIQIYWPGQLPYKGFEMFTTVQNRLVDGAECLTTYYGSTHPIMDIRWLVFMADTLDEGKKIVQVMRNYYQPVYDKYNVIPVINTVPASFTHWFSKGPVTKMEQMKGYKCRVYSKATADMVKAWGCHPVTIPIVELYTALQRGVADAVVTSFHTGVDVKFWEVLPYATENAWSYGGLNTVIINKKALAELPPGVQKVVLEAGERASEEIFKASPAEDERLKDLFRKGGAQILKMDPGEREKLAKASMFLIKEWVDMNGKTGVEMLKEVKTATGIDVLKKAGL